MKFFSLFILGIILALPLCLSAQTMPPRIFFSDLESGPNVGGQKDHGVWVTIWGKGFGAQRGSSTVTVGGGEAADYPIWSDGKITFQLGPAAKTGEIIVNVVNVSPVTQKGKDGSHASTGVSSSAVPSNGLPFVVRAGRIFFVALNGSDHQRGSLDAPWITEYTGSARVNVSG